MTSFRNILAMSLVAVVSTIASAQQYGPYDRRERGPQGQAERLRVQSQRINQIIQQEADGLTMEQIRMVSQKLNDINSIVRNQNPPAPPMPPPPPPQRTTSLKGKFETTEFSFEVRDLYDLHAQCRNFVKSRSLGSVDDIDVSVNYGPAQRLHNSSSYWKTPNEICSQLTPVAQAAGVRAPVGKTVVVGQIETTDFEFQGFGRSEIYSQCEALVNSTPSLGSVDDIKMSVDFGAQKALHNSSSYWRGAFEICGQIVQNL